MLTKGMPLFSVVSLAVLCLSAVPARAGLYGFIPVTHHSGSVADAVAGQFSFTVAQSASDVLFTFANSGPMPSSIAGVYFDDGAGILDSLLAPINGSGVRFKSGGKPRNLSAPRGYDFTADFWATAKESKGRGKNKNGVDPGEWVTIPFTLESGKTFGDLLSALELGAANLTEAAGTLRVGLYVRSIGTSGKSDAFIDPVPLPGAFVLGVLGLSAAGWRLRKSA
jgi:hypothetical protein